MTNVSMQDIIAIIEKAEVTADIDSIKGGSTFTDAGIDSLDLMNVLLGIEVKYDIKIPDSDIAKLSTVDTTVQYLTQRLG